MKKFQKKKLDVAEMKILRWLLDKSKKKLKKKKKKKKIELKILNKVCPV